MKCNYFLCPCTPGTCSTQRDEEDEEGQNVPFGDFSFEDVCKQSHTLLWDLVQDDSAVSLF